MNKSFCTAFILTFLATGLYASFAFAQTSTSSSDLQSLIFQLQSQIKALQTRINELEIELGVKREPSIDDPRSSTSIALPTFDRTLSLGSIGDDVRNLQRFLSQFPDVYPEGLITAYFGPLTEKAVQRWQAKHDIVKEGTSETTGYGRIGPKTRSKLNELLTEGAGKSGVIPPGLLRAPGLQDKVATITPVATTTPSSDGASTATTTPSGTIPAIPAEPIGQTGTTTIPATSAEPTTGTPPPSPPTTTPPPSPTPSPTPPPSTTDTTAPMISNVQATNITTKSAAITWTTNEAADGQVEYGLTSSYGSTVASSSLVTSQYVTVSNLQSNTTYHYRVKSKDAAGNLATSGDQTFITLAPPSSQQSIGFAVIKVTPTVTAVQGGSAEAIVDLVPIPGVSSLPYVYMDSGLFFTITATGTQPATNNIYSGTSGPGSWCQFPCLSLRFSYKLTSSVPPGTYQMTGRFSMKDHYITPDSAPGVVTKEVAIPLTITASSTSYNVTDSSLALILRFLSATLDDIQKQIQKLAR